MITNHQFCKGMTAAHLPECCDVAASIGYDLNGLYGIRDWSEMIDSRSISLWICQLSAKMADQQQRSCTQPNAHTCLSTAIVYRTQNELSVLSKPLQKGLHSQYSNGRCHLTDLMWVLILLVLSFMPQHCPETWWILRSNLCKCNKSLLFSSDRMAAG